jgi:uncharacterized SAM-binding protein YcdF (DUF218 family)
MTVYLSKLLPLFIYPFGLSLLILFAALLLKKERIRTFFIALSILIYCLSGNRWVAYSLTRSLEWQYLPRTTYPTAQAMVVLGGGTESIDYPRQSAEINGAGDRIIYALSLYRKGVAPLVVLSGGNISWYDNRSSTPAQEMADLWNFMGGPSGPLLLQDKSMNTHDDAVLSSQILKDRGIDQIILVTSAQHMPRSVALFQKQGMTVTPAPTDYSITQSAWDSLFQADLPTKLIYIIPNISYISMTTSALKEYFGIIVYQRLGWL